MKKLHLAPKFEKTLNNVVISVTYSLLRQVCRKSRRNDCSPTIWLKFLPREFSTCPADDRLRLSALALQFALVLASAFPTPSLADTRWKSGSTFVPDQQPAGWTSSAFTSNDEALERGNAYRRPAKIRFSVDPALTPIANLRNLISTAEAGHMDYDAVVYSATKKPPALPTSMTVCEIRDWIVATPGQNHAIGRYQFIPSTLFRLAKMTGHHDGSGCEALFSPALQDRWANILIKEAGYLDFVEGALTPDDFMDALASVWAGLPLASGKSKYHGKSGNAATLSRNHYASAIGAIFPAQVRLSWNSP